MAMKVLSDGKATATDGKATAPGQAGAGNGAAVRVTARVAAAFRILGTSLLQAFERIASAHASAGRRKQMKLVESLALGNRRQLLLIDCGNQRYLVGAGADSVGSILAMDQGSASGDLKAKGPELVRRNGQAAAEHRRAGAAAEAGPALWR
jgi:flagellar biogenesis protein FliO